MFLVVDPLPRRPSLLRIASAQNPLLNIREKGAERQAVDFPSHDESVASPVQEKAVMNHPSSIAQSKRHPVCGLRNAKVGKAEPGFLTDLSDQVDLAYSAGLPPGETALRAEAEYLLHDCIHVTSWVRLSNVKERFPAALEKGNQPKRPLALQFLQPGPRGRPGDPETSAIAATFKGLPFQWRTPLRGTRVGIRETCTSCLMNTG